MEIQNHYLTLPKSMTEEEVLLNVCDAFEVEPTDPCAFSAIIKPHTKYKDCVQLKINYFDGGDNPYSPIELVHTIYTQPAKDGIRYVQPPLEQWLEYFKPLLMAIVNETHPAYEILIPDRDDMISILYLTVCKLHNQGYYLHKELIKRSYRNALNYECRSLKGTQITDSLDMVIAVDDENAVTLLDQIADEESTDWARQQLYYTEKDYKEDLFNKIKETMLRDMSEFAFNRILLQLKTHTVDTMTSRKLRKYREMLNPGYVRRPNAFGKPKHKKQGDNKDGKQ